MEEDFAGAEDTDDAASRRTAAREEVVDLGNGDAILVVHASEEPAPTTMISKARHLHGQRDASDAAAPPPLSAARRCAYWMAARILAALVELIHRLSHSDDISGPKQQQQQQRQPTAVSAEAKEQQQQRRSATLDMFGIERRTLPADAPVDKRAQARGKKLLGDLCLLAGAPIDVRDDAVRRSGFFRCSRDGVRWCAAPPCAHALRQQRCARQGVRRPPLPRWRAHRPGCCRGGRPAAALAAARAPVRVDTATAPPPPQQQHAYA
eukprot:scaffold6918_cov380-Prasinococcus_capsulatus_cf.AAC.1